MVRRRAILKGGMTLGAGALVGGVVSGQSTQEVVLHDFEQPFWPWFNDRGRWASASSFANGGGSGELVDGTLRLEYDDAGQFTSGIGMSIVDSPTLTLQIRGDSGGEETDVAVEVGGIRDQLSNLTDDTIETSYSTVAVDFESACASLSSPGSVVLDFGQGASGAVEIDRIAFTSEAPTGGTGSSGTGGTGNADGGNQDQGNQNDGSQDDTGQDDTNQDDEDEDDGPAGDDVFENDRLNADAITESTTLAELHPDYDELYVSRMLTEYLPDSAGGTGNSDAAKAGRFDVDLDAIRANAEDGSLELGSLGTQAIDHVKDYARADFPAHATVKLLPRLMLLPDETEELTLHNQPSRVWNETAGPQEAANNPSTLIQDPWPTDARTYDPDEVRERDRAHDQPQYTDQEWGDAGNLSDDVLHDDDNPVLDAVGDGVHPTTGEDISGGFTANSPMQAEARMHVQNDGYWYQYLEFENTGEVPHHLDAAVLWWAGPSGMGQTLADGHYNNVQRPDPSLGHPQRDVIEVVYDESRGLSAYAIRLCFHDQPYNMRTAYPNQKWSLEIGTPVHASGVSADSAQDRQEILDTMLETLHVELETDMDRNDDLLDALNLRYRVPN